MKLARFLDGDVARIGRVEGDEIVDLWAAGFGASMRALLDATEGDVSDLASIDGPRHTLTDVTLLPPVADAQKCLALGMNYKDHADKAAAAGVKVPDTQVWFNKQVSCLNGPYSGIEMPRVSDKLDFEAELVAVIGKRCRHVAREDALSVIAGYAVGNDVSVRDWQMRSPTFTLGKSFDTHGPVGPWITTADEIADPQDLAIRSWVNGDLRQDANTSLMIHKIADQIAYISQAFTLMPGDLLFTGTPAGTGIETDSYLHKGDVVRIEIEGLGHIENTVIAEPS